MTLGTIYNIRAMEMSWSVECLPHRNEDLCSDILNTHKKLGAVLHASNAKNGGPEDRDMYPQNQ